MTEFSSILITGSLFFSFIVCLILFFRKSELQFANRLLSVTFFGFIWFSFVLLTGATKSVNIIKYFFGFGIPVYYTIPVVAYLYIRSTLMQQTRLIKSDWLHFLPAIISFLSITPFYFSDMATKSKMNDLLVQNINNVFFCKIGLFPNSWNIYLRPTQGLIYAALSWKCIAPLWSRKNHLIKSTVLKTWILTFSIFITLSYLNLAIATVLGYLQLSYSMHLFSVIRVPYAAGAILFLCLSAYPFFYPEILYGATVSRHQPDKINELAEQVGSDTIIEGPNDIIENNGLYKNKEIALPTEQVLKYALLIEGHIIECQFF